MQLNVLLQHCPTLEFSAVLVNCVPGSSPLVLHTSDLTKKKRMKTQVSLLISLITFKPVVDNIKSWSKLFHFPR